MCYPKEKASMDQQRTIWTVIIAAVIVITVVVSAMAYQSTQNLADLSENNPTDLEPYRALTFDLNLPPLSSARYVLWVVDEAGQYTLIKEFMVNDALFTTDLTGRPLSTSVDVEDFDLHQAESFMVTIEAKEGAVTAPSSTIVLQTKQRSGASYRLKFPHDLAKAVGSYILATPTNGPSTAELSGVWFAAPAGLQLPTLPDSWLYAAWLKQGQTWLPIGAFTSATAADDRAQFSGPRAGYESPGEDFLTNARVSDPVFPLDLTADSTEVVITLQPKGLGTSGDRPLYYLPLLQAPVAPTAVTNTAYDLAAVETMPSGVIRIITR